MANTHHLSEQVLYGKILQIPIPVSAQFLWGLELKEEEKKEEAEEVEEEEVKVPRCQMFFYFVDYP